MAQVYQVTHSSHSDAHGNDYETMDNTSFNSVDSTGFDGSGNPYTSVNTVSSNLVNVGGIEMTREQYKEHFGKKPQAPLSYSKTDASQSEHNNDEQHSHADEHSDAGVEDQSLELSDEASDVLNMIQNDLGGAAYNDISSSIAVSLASNGGIIDDSISEQLVEAFELQLEDDPHGTASEVVNDIIDEVSYEAGYYLMENAGMTPQQVNDFQNWLFANNAIDTVFIEASRGRTTTMEELASVYMAEVERGEHVME